MRKVLMVVALLLLGAPLLWWFNRPQPLPVRLLAVERGAVETLVANTRAGTLKGRHCDDPQTSTGNRTKKGRQGCDGQAQILGE